ncbi:MAG: type II toxin-antitoxin system CcdA family antitoxin [Gammaproteobacteria bacterium]|nr:type II toxin-antitoxin system CcdA family antitoxin [Gammaproteobacteria bacterium]
MSTSVGSKKQKVSSTSSEANIKHSPNYSASERWKRENALAIEAYNQLVAQHGVFSDSLRRF